MKLIHNKKFIFFSIALLNIAIAIIVYLTGSMKFEEIDDFRIQNAFNGVEGFDSPFAKPINYILSIILMGLFKYFPRINYYSIMLFAAQFVAFCIINYVLLKKFEGKKGIIVTIFFSLIFYSINLMFFQFTRVAYICVTAGLILAMYAFDIGNNKKRNIIIATIIFIIGSLIRVDVIVTIIPFIILYLICNFKKKTLLYFACTLSICGLLLVFNNYMYNRNDEMKVFNEYDDVRRPLFNYGAPSYNKNKEVYESINWEPNDFIMFASFDYAEPEIYSKENMKVLVEHKEFMELDFNKTIKTFFEYYEKDFNKLIAIILIILFAINIKRSKNKLFVLGTFLGTLAIHMLFIVVGRTVDRVVFSNYLISIVILLYNMNLSEITIKHKKIFKFATIYVAILFLICSVLTISTAATLLERAMINTYRIEDVQNFKKIIEYTSGNKENVYLYNVFSMQVWFRAYNIFEMPEKNKFENIRSLGGYDVFNDKYNRFLEKYEIDNLYKSFVEKENVYFVTNNRAELIVKFLKENYNIDSEYEIIEEFNEVKIYKIRKI